MPLYGDNYVVTSLADSGPGTLREGLAIVNASSGGTVSFAVSGQITLAAPLHLGTIGLGVTINGNNQITISGGGKVAIFYATWGVFSLNGLTLTNAGGRALSVSGDRTSVGVSRTTFLHNTGGAISVFRDAWVQVSQCAFEDNSVDPVTGAGGAISVSAISGATIVNSTFYNNRAARGGAIASDLGYVHLQFSTIAGNSAATGGGVWWQGALPTSVTLDNTIVANNTGGNCGGSAITGGGGNLSYPDNTCPGTVADPKLGPFANNGGPTKTMALLSGSPAIDAAPACQTNVDQRGIARPQGPACDAGAYEKSPISFAGFFAPISNLPLINEHNAGRAIPIKFSAGGYFGMSIIAPGYPASQPVSCVTALPTGGLVPIDTPGASGLSYDNFSKTYSINWKTEKGWAGTCRQLVLRLTDGVDRMARFRFR